MKRILIILLLVQLKAYSQTNLKSMNNYLAETTILNYSDSMIQSVVKNKNWLNMDTVERAKSIYNFVRDDIKFGYNSSDNITAAEVLKDGYGQCNTKATLLMALLRSAGIPNRIHGFTIDKTLQKGAISGVWYKLSPKNILHSWVEVYINNNWYFLEGVILDTLYLNKLQEKYKDTRGEFCGFGVYTGSFENPPIDWNLNHTFIQDKGINQDFGLFDTPDEFYNKHQQEIGRFRKFMYRTIVRKRMNQNVNQIRNKQ